MGDQYSDQKFVKNRTHLILLSILFCSIFLISIAGETHAAPTVTIISPSPGAANDGTPLLTYTVSEGTVVVKADGAIINKVSGDSLDALTDGPHTVRVEAIDSQNNVGFAEVDFTIDTSAPIVTINSPEPGASKNNAPLLTYTVSEGTVVVKVDGVAVTKVSGNNLDPLSEGPHTVHVESMDAAGNKGYADVTFTVLDQALVGLWHIDGDWMDSSGSGNNGVYSGATFSSDARLGSYAGHFDGVDDFVTFENNTSMLFTGPHTVSSWVKLDSFPTEWTPLTVVQKYRYGVFYNNSGKFIRAHRNLGSTLYYLDYGTTLSTGVWYHVAQVFDGTNLQIYINGELKAQGQGLVLGYGNSNNAALIGMGWDAPPVTTYKFAGSFDEAALYSRALTTAEINRAYNDGLGRVALWHMDGDWTDASGSGNNGTANNGAFSENARVGANAGSFDGLASSITGTAYGLPLSNAPRSISAWVKAGSGAQDGTIIQYGTGSTSNFQLFIDGSNRAAIGSESGSISGTTSLSDGQWHYVVGVYEGPGTKTVRIYVDAVQENSGTITELNTTGDSFSLGTFIGGGGYFSGLIDEIAVYNRSITVYEINKAYSEGLARVAHWRMDGDWTDASGNGKNGTPSSGAAFSTDARVGNRSGNFNGSSGYVDIGNWFNFQTFSIEMWVKAGATQVQYADIIDNNHSTLGWVIEQASTNTNQYIWGIADGSGLINFSLQANQWTHIAITRDANTRVNTLYINGSPLQSTTGTHDITYNSNPFIRLCGWWYGGGRNWNGLMDEVAIYNRSLSEGEVMNHYAAIVPYVQIVSPVSATNNSTPLLNYIIVNGTTTAVKVDGSTVSKISGETLDILSDGDHTVRVEAVNSAGILGSAEKTFTIDTVPPTVSINPVTSPTTTTTQTITGSMEAGALVTVLVNTTAVAGPVTYPTSTTWSCTVTSLAWGANIITVTAKDAAGNSTTATTNILQYNINISNVAVNNNVLDTSGSNTASIFFTIDHSAAMTLKIVPQKQGATGTPVFQASQSCPAAGAYSFSWDGKDSMGKVVPDEAYLYILEAAVDGSLAGVYSPAASGTSGTPSFTSSGDIDPFRNVPKTINYSVSMASRCTLWVAVPYTLWSTVPAWGYKILDNVPLGAGVNHSLEWTGRSRDGKIVARPGMFAPGTTVVMDLFLTCASTPLAENYIITSGDTPKISQVIIDPYEVQLSYGQFTRIKYHLSRDANVTIALISPAGGSTTLVSSQSQSSGDQEFDLNMIDATDASGKKFVLTEEENYSVRITAANPVTGSSSTAYASLQITY